MYLFKTNNNEKKKNKLNKLKIVTSMSLDDVS